MPLYSYEHPNTKERITVIQKMSDEHVFVDDDGIKWNRVFDIPHAAIDTLATINPLDKDAFVKRTARPGMTIGDMWDESAALSQKRARIYGKDPVKEKAISDYKAKTDKLHPNA